LVLDKEAKKRARDEKYSLSSNRDRATKGKGKKKGKGKEIVISSPNIPSDTGNNKKGGGGGGGAAGKNGKRTYSSLTGKSVPLRMMTASGNFRKSGGYFKKKLRTQTTSEFSS
jgi:hypothetical protein